MNNMNNYIDELYENFMDEIINTTPLTTSRIREFDDAISINQHIITNIYNIRRYLEMDESMDQSMNESINGSVNNTIYNQYYNSMQNPSLRSIHLPSQNTLQNTLQNNLQNTISNMINNIFDTILTDTIQTDNDFEDVKVTLTKEEFDKFETFNIQNEDIEKECNICMDTYNLNDKVVKLPCKHFFHTDCIFNWLCNEKITCPICRMDTRNK